MGMKQCGICSFKSDNLDEFNQHAAATHGLGPLASKAPPPPKQTAVPVSAAPAPVSAADDFVAKGYNGQLTVRERSIVISRKGAMALLTQGLKGEKEIALEHVTSVQLKGAGLTAGYIQFTFMGGQEAKGGVFQAGQDENSISFYKGSQTAFERARELIEERRRRLSSASVQAALSPAEELMRFAQLHKDGVINDDEFAAKKKQLLGL